MQRRAIRLTLLTLLLAAGALGAFFIWTTEQRIVAIEAQRIAAETAVDRLLPSIAGIAAAQQAYVDIGQRDQASMVRVSSLLDRIATDAAGLKSIQQAPGNAASLEGFWSALSALMSADTNAKESLAAGDALAAADVLLASSRPQLATLETTLVMFRESEVSARAAARATLVRQAALVVGGIAVLWTIGLVALALGGGESHRQAAADDSSTPVAAQVTVPSPIDLAATADLAMAIARLADAGELPHLLGRAAAILEARGLILWMGAGEELFAAATHGFEPSVLQRLRPIGRMADNATAAAWRARQLRSVPADASGYGALVAPLEGTSGCVGVLAAEVAAGREEDAATRAVTTIIASQLAGVLAAWPAASAPAETSESDRHAAAS